MRNEFYFENNITLRGPVTEECILALVDATKNEYDGLYSDWDWFDPEAGKLPEDYVLPRDGASFTARSETEAQLDWLEEMTTNFPEITFEILYSQNLLQKFGKAVAFDGQVTNSRIPSFESNLLNGGPAEFSAMDFDHYSKQEVKLFIDTYHTYPEMIELFELLTNPKCLDFVDISDDLRAFAITCFNANGINSH